MIKKYLENINRCVYKFKGLLLKFKEVKSMFGIVFEK
jgi:hypothetical protein